MASSYSTDLKLELMVTGENAGTWGDYYKYKFRIFYNKQLVVIKK
jgi:hypothetical protein